ncbi:MAG: serine/threonine protein kinase [Myxococcales bacterium]|nr:serine/threonine protein kinase [Myxococcales bacterium]
MVPERKERSASDDAESDATASGAFAISTTDAGRAQRGIHANRGVDEGDHAGDADPEGAFEAERQRVNLARAHTVGLVLAVGNALAFSWRGVSLLLDDVDPSRARGLLVVHGASLPIALLAAFATLDRFARAPWLAGYRRRVGEWVAVHTAVLGACMAMLAFVNGLKEPFGFGLGVVTVSSLIIADRRVQVAATAAMALLMSVVSFALFGAKGGLATLIPSAFFLCAVAWLSRMVLDGFVKDVAVLIELGRMGAELDAEVQRQTASLVAQAAEVERLNAVLAERVRETSRQLATALEKLAKGERVDSGLPPGTVLVDRFEIQRPIGRGAMGVVYEAIDLATSSRVAVKVLATKRREDVDGMFRLIREAEAIASIGHPAIVKTEHITVSNDGQLFIVLEYVEGRTLHAARETDGKWSRERVALLGATLFDALAVAHRAGITHRDVKPENVMLVGDAPGVKLLDFGLARVTEAVQPTSTNHEWILGTPAYLSPEQVLAPETVGPASDVYATALVLYEMLAGCAPYAAERSNEWIARHAFAEPTPITKLVPGLEREFASTLMRCLSKSPSDRPTAAEASRVLSAIASELGAPPIDVVERARNNRLAQRRATPSSGLNRAVKPIEPTSG